MIERTAILERLRAAVRRSRIVVLTGPRQCGKTTLARQLLSMARPGMPLNRHAQWVSAKPLPGVIWIF